MGGGQPGLAMELRPARRAIRRRSPRNSRLHPRDHQLASRHAGGRDRMQPGIGCHCGTLLQRHSLYVRRTRRCPDVSGSAAHRGSRRPQAHRGRYGRPGVTTGAEGTAPPAPGTGSCRVVDLAGLLDREGYVSMWSTWSLPIMLSSHCQRCHVTRGRHRSHLPILRRLYLISRADEKPIGSAR